MRIDTLLVYYDAQHQVLTVQIHFLFPKDSVILSVTDNYIQHLRLHTELYYNYST